MSCRMERCTRSKDDTANTMIRSIHQAKNFNNRMDSTRTLHKTLISVITSTDRVFSFTTPNFMTRTRTDTKPGFPGRIWVVGWSALDDNEGLIRFGDKNSNMSEIKGLLVRFHRKIQIFIRLLTIALETFRIFKSCLMDL